MGFLLNPTVLLALALALALGAVHHYRTELHVTQAQYEAFQAKVEALGKQAEAHKLIVETQNANQIRDAVSGRDAALARLRVAEAAANSGRGRLSTTPLASLSSGQKCIDPATLAPAIERYRNQVAEFRRGVAKIVGDGDEAQIDANALLKSWPH